MSADIQLAYVEIFIAAPDDLERSPQEISQFQMILTEFKERFPKSTRLQSMPIDPEHPLDSIRATLLKASKRTENVVDLYKHNRIPIPTFSRLLGRDLYHSWLNIVADADLTLLSSDGTEQEHQESQSLLTTRDGFLIEPITLFTFSSLGLLDRLTKLGDICVAQRSLDQLHELQARRRTADRQTGVIGMVDGEVFVHEITPEEAVRTNSALTDAAHWAEKHSRVVGLTEPLTKDDKKWARVLGVPAMAAMLVAKQRALVLLTDDKNFGDIAKQNYGVSFVNSQAVLIRLAALKFISQEDYDRAVLKLFESGYTLTNVNDDHLFTIISAEQFQLTTRVKRALRAFEPATIALVPACAAVAGLVVRIYIESIPDQMREQLSFYMLDALAANHPKIQVKRLVYEFVQQRMTPVLALQLAKIVRLLNRW